MKPNKETYFSLGEQEWIDALVNVYEVGIIDAQNRVIRYKREQAFMYRQQGNDKLADQLLDEIGELDPHRNEDAPASKKHFKKIILPDDKPVQADPKIIIVK